MTQFEYNAMQDMTWMFEISGEELNGSDPMFETSDDVLEDCFEGDIDLDSPGFSHSFNQTELEERLLREHKEVMNKLRNLPKRNCVVPGDYHYDEEGRQIDDLPF